MILLNDGKFSFLDISLFKRRYKLLIFITKESTNQLRDCLLIDFQIWKGLKLIKSYKNEKIKLKSKP